MQDTRTCCASASTDGWVNKPPGVPSRRPRAPSRTTLLAATSGSGPERDREPLPFQSSPGAGNRSAVHECKVFK
jgi:hypothetical protein